ncbi:Hypothetical protein, putative [Bodo saltans]|uniref:Uncharacterized protein n=1 Tax=Bodo saltans TaxID=75058 RepID=A0A0S4IMF2_BODSA|nr:Hypothetical protein, putative [Bodo saltans]|eukprot:CUE73485.1 Hypothetical protein, putative [Bodo saltans]
MHDVKLSCVRVLDLDTMVWSRVPQLCTHAGDRLRRVWGHKISSVTLNGKGKLIIFGGMEGNDTNDDIYVIDEATLRLDASLSVTGSQMTSPDHVRSNVKSRRCHGACTYRDVFIFIVGGRDHQHFFNDMWCYNALLNEWIPVTEYASPQDMQTYFDNPILAEPGRQIRQKYAMAVSRHAGLQPPSSLLSSMCPRTGVSMVISGEYLYVTGGFLFFLFGSTNFNDMHVYSIRDHHWENVQLPRNSLAGGVDDDVLTPTSIPATFDVSARLQVAGEYGCDVPKPFTMASLVEWPLSPGHPSQRQGSQAIGTQWLLFGGRMGDHPRAAQYRVRIFEPWRPLTWLAARPRG